MNANDRPNKVYNLNRRCIDFCSQISGLMNKKKYIEALEVCDKWIENEHSSSPYERKGIILNDMNLKEEALKFYDKAIDLSRNAYNLYYEKGKILSELNKPEEAILCFNKSIELNPDVACGYHEKGKVFSQLNKQEEALLCLDKALEKANNSYDITVSKGRVLGKLGRIEEALKHFDRAIKIYMFSPEAFRSKGILLSKVGRKEEAIKVFSSYLEMNKCPLFLCYRARVYNDLGKSQLSLKDYKEVLEKVELSKEDKDKYYISDKHMEYIQNTLQELSLLC